MIPVCAGNTGSGDQTHIPGSVNLGARNRFRVIPLCGSGAFHTSTIEYVVSSREFETCRNYCRECLKDYEHRKAAYP